MKKAAAMADNGWWGDLDHEVLACLREGPKSPRDLARKLGLSAEGVTSVLLMLAAQGKVRVTAVELRDTA